MAAEIRRSLPANAALDCCFNEAAANGRGNPTPTTAFPAAPSRASMRPRRMAAEIVGAWNGTSPTMPASMRPRRMAAEIG